MGAVGAVAAVGAAAAVAAIGALAAVGAMAGVPAIGATGTVAAIGAGRASCKGLTGNSINAIYRFMPRTKRTEERPIYNRLAALRADRGMSRQDVADAVGVHYQTIGYLERGEYRPSLLLALEIARLFSLPVEAIFSLDPIRPMSEQLAPGWHKEDAQ